MFFSRRPLTLLGAAAALFSSGPSISLGPIMGPSRPLPGAPVRKGHAKRPRNTTLFIERNGKRERERRVRQNAHLNQLNSHKPGTVQPRHIFGGA